MNNRSRSARLALSILALAVLAGCGESVKGAPEAGDDIRVDAFTWRVRTAEQIGAEYTRAGKDPGEGREVGAYVGRVNGVTSVTTEPPQYVNDRVTCELGHEVMHLALGDYHAQREAK